MIHCPATSYYKHYWNNHCNRFLYTIKFYEIFFKIIHVIDPTNNILKRYRDKISESFVFYECIFVYFLIDVEHLLQKKPPKNKTFILWEEQSGQRSCIYANFS